MGASADPLPRGRVALLFRAHGENPGRAASSPCTTRWRVAVALDPTLVETRRAAVDVETTGRLTTGATIVDWRGQWGRLANTEVAVAVDAERFRGLFFDAMARLAEGAAAKRT